MKVFKFGGASVKDAQGVKNVAEIVKQHLAEQPLLVISAMGKTTNALEEVLQAFFKRENNTQQLLEKVREYHYSIAEILFTRENPVWDELENLFAELYWAIEETQIKSYDYEYDQIVSVGELLSTRIVAAYFEQAGIPVQWLDARDLIRTDDTFREGNIDWEITQKQIQDKVGKLKSNNPNVVVITQGFIGATSENFSTTLGREGSDYSAAVFSYCLDASEMVIWKDVPGVLNADPKVFSDATLIEELSYYDAIELAYYGATVIHPKTIKPLQNKAIPLRVKSFVNPQLPGTRISTNDHRNAIPTYIQKNNQVLISISPRDFSFIIEENFKDIFKHISDVRLKVNLMQNSALKFSVCVNDETERLQAFLVEMQKRYLIKYNHNCTLLTVRNYSEALIERLTQQREILVETRSRNTVQMVLRQSNH